MKKWETYSALPEYKLHLGFKTSYVGFSTPS